MRSYLLAAISCALGMSSDVYADSAAPDQSGHLVRMYKMTALTNPDTQQIFFPTDLNNRGELLGSTSKLDTFYTSHNASWKRGTVKFLPELPNTVRSDPATMNDRGDFVATDYVNNTFRGVLGVNGSVTDLGSPAGTTSFTPVGLNNQRQVIGYASDYNSYVWSKGTYTTLALAVDSGGPHANAINNAGTVAGYERTPFYSGDSASIWRDGGIELLGVLPGQNSSQAYALNDFDHVVGISSRPGPQQAFFWKDGAMSALPPLVAGDSTTPMDINDLDQVVGYESLGSNYTPILWEHGQPVDLVTLIRPEDLAQVGPTLKLSTATEINVLGQIVVWASPIDPFGMGDVPYLLTPVFQRQ